MPRPMTSKKQIKKSVNDLGAFVQMPFTVVEKSALMDDEVKRNEYGFSPEQLDAVPDGTFLFKGVASTGELNRNDYIIRPSAWSDAIPAYMGNPIVLFQHNPEKAIGQTLNAEVVNDTLVVSGFIYADLDAEYTKSSIRRGVYKALSTGHITVDFEFEDVETGAVLSKDELNKKVKECETWGQFIALMDKYKMAVTKLEFVEWSVVAIGSNRAALRLNDRARILKNYYGASLNVPDMPEIVDPDVNEDEDPTDETPAPVAPVAEPVADPPKAEDAPAPKAAPEAPAAPDTTENPAKTDTTQEPAPTSDATNEPENAGETPAAEIKPEDKSGEIPAEPKVETPAAPTPAKPVEDAVKPSAIETATPQEQTNAKPEIKAEAEVDYSAQVNAIAGVVRALAVTVNDLLAEITKVKATVNAIPVRKGLIMAKPFTAPETTEEKAEETKSNDADVITNNYVASLFKKAGIDVKE